MEFKVTKAGDTTVLTFIDNQTKEVRSVAFTKDLQDRMCIDEFIEHVSEKLEELVVYSFDVGDHAPEVEVEDPMDVSDIDPEDIISLEPETPREFLVRNGFIR